jgi:hypothetical protein
VSKKETAMNSQIAKIVADQLVSERVAAAARARAAARLRRPFVRRERRAAPPSPAAAGRLRIAGR